jgi:muramidase (phage lysozyme)
MARITANEAGGSNVLAFLDMIAWSELGTGLLTPATDDGYKVCVGSTPAKPILFTSYAEHPRIRSSELNSDAAGRYQFMGRYWDAYRRQLNLPDFGPISQDRWAIQLLRECKAVAQIQAGHLAAAVQLCASRWASLPGANYNQHENTIASLQRSYLDAGGQVV